MNRVLAALAEGPDGARIPHSEAVRTAREVLGGLRARIRGGEGVPAEALLPRSIAGEVASRFAARTGGTLRRVVNATGIVLHTNLGRAPLSREDLLAVVDRAGGYCNLEYDLAARRRGSRHDHAEGLLRQLTGAEAALVVNNNAAAVLLVLAALGRGRDVVVSRGELVEIGGGFRIPEVMEQSGARLVEVGTTNRTRIGDYARACGPDTALLFQAHRSNFRIVGFTEEPGTPALAALARTLGVPLVVDLGSGMVSDPGVPWTADEPGPAAVLAAGADLVCFSGDKLLGGPQAGVIVGRRDLVEVLRRHPLLRALRVDKLTTGLLEAVTRRHVRGDLAGIPALASLGESAGSVRRRCAALVRQARRLGAGSAVRLEVVPSEGLAGGGTLPDRAVPSFAVAVTVDGRSEAAVESALRLGEPPVVARVADGRVLLDLRTVRGDDARDLARRLAGLAAAFEAGEGTTPLEEGNDGGRDHDDEG